MYCVAVAVKMTKQVSNESASNFHSSVKTIWMIQKDFRDDATSAAHIKVWHKCFKDDCESAESDPRSGRPAASRTPETVECGQASINEGH